jgi:preprotein translocase subunit YajC
MWLLLIRPQQQRARAQRSLLSTLAVGDEVLTVGGILGTITEIVDDRITLSVSPTVELTFVRPAISQRVPADAAGEDPDGSDDPATRPDGSA